VPIRHGDFRRFDLERTFDLVTCLFSSIGHVRDESDLDAAIAAMARHVAPGGALLLEPWLTPDSVDEDFPATLDTVSTERGVCARASRSERRGDVLVVQYAWSVATDSAIHTAEESFRMPLFTQERYERAVTDAGLSASWLEVSALSAGRGLLVGLRELEG
jgi:SAM-dependent methyltransferase